MLVGILAVVVAACGGEDSPEPAAPEAGPQAEADTLTIDHVLRTDDRFSSLVAALDSAGLDSTLRTDGPYTLFAPPNSAFDELPPGTLPALLNERPDRLQEVLRQHIVPQRAAIAGQAGAWSVPTLSGDSLRLTVTDTSVTIRNARVVDFDIETANGLIHVVDRVLRPAEEGPDASEN
jgi:uncharacterized surface protein with fasciclin (FAS1) repeats